MACRTIPQAARTAGIRAAALLALAAIPTRSASATEVEPRTLGELVRLSSTIVVGTVTGQASRWGDASRRWMVTDYTVQTEDVILDDGTLQPGGTFVLTFWGGTIGGETQLIAHQTLPDPGRRYVMLLREGWAGSGFSPLAGFNQGLLEVQQGGVEARQHGGPARPVSASELVTWLRSNLKALKATPLRTRAKAARDADGVMRAGELQPEAGPRAAQAAAVQDADALLPAEPVAVPRPDRTVQRTDVEARLDSQPVIQAKTAGAGAIEPSATYAIDSFARLPIVINQFPSSYSWSPEDQYQMSKWNYYGGWFRVSAAPTGTYGWANDRFDLAGFPSSASMQAVYGFPWDPEMTAVTVIRIGTFPNPPIIVEADVAMNPAYTFTLNDEEVFDGSSKISFRHAMMHELGHVWGAGHSYSGLALMRDTYPDDYAPFSMPFKDDADTIRALYPGNAVPRTDLGVHLFHAGSGTDWREAVMSTTVVAGGTLSVSHFTVENVGTTTVASPTLDWYLTKARHYSAPYHFLQSVSLGQSLPPAASLDPSSLRLTLPVPTNVNGGQYYLNAFVPNDGGATQSGFPFSNNSAWTRSKVTVVPRVMSVEAPPFGGGSQSYGTVYLGSQAGPDGFYVALVSSDPDVVQVPSLVYVPPDWPAVSFDIVSAQVTAPRQVTVWATGYTVTVTGTFTVLVASEASSNQVSGAIGQKVVLKTTLTHTADGAPLPNKLVRFTIDGDPTAYTALTNASGVAKLPYVIPQGLGPGLRVYSADFLGDASTAPYFTAGTIMVSTAATKLVPVKVSGSVGQLVTLSVKLVTSAGNTPVVGRTVIFSLSPGGNDGTGVTDSNGRATLKVRIPAAGVGAFSYHTRFAGDSLYHASTGTGALTVSQAKTKLTVKSVAGLRGTTVTLSAVLKRTTDSALLDGRTLSFSVNGQTYTAATDATGKAAVQHVVPANIVAGTYPIAVTFAGDALHLAASGAGVLTAK